MSINLQESSDSAFMLPRSPPLPFIYTAPPREWSLITSFNPTSRSHNERLQCLCAEIVTDHQNSLIVILDIKYYDTTPPSNSQVNLVLGGTEVKTVALNVSKDKGLYLWGSLPKSRVKDKLQISLHVSTNAIAWDSLLIGVLLVTEPPIRADLACIDSHSSEELPEPADHTSPLTSPSYENARNLSDDEIKYDPPKPVLLRNAYDLILQDRQHVELRTRNFSRIVDDWTPAEVAASRRLVRFDRHQEGHIVHLSFTPHLPEEPFDELSQVVVSCIKWPETNSDFFITSFDVLRLAEFILKLTMNTEMKNRVRRNMATVPYITLPKGKKPSSSHPDPRKDPYTLIMSFDTYQPRSIEKSIKIYDWEDLKNCLAKILQRFIVADPDASPENIQFEHQLDAAKKLKRRKRRPTWVTSSEPQNNLKNEASPVEWPTVTPTTTLRKPSVRRYVRRTPLPKLYLKPVTSHVVGPNRTRHADYPGGPSIGPISSSSSNMSPYIWDQSFSRKGSTIASSADYFEDSSLSLSSVHSDSSDQSFFDTLPIPREHRGDILPTSLPPPPTLSHRSSFEGPVLSANVAPEEPIFMDSLHQSSLESLTVSPEDPSEMYPGGWPGNAPSHPLTPAITLSEAPMSSGIYAIPVPRTMPVPLPQLPASAYFANGGYHEAVSSSINPSWPLDHGVPPSYSQLRRVPQQERAWRGQEAINNTHLQQSYNMMEEDSEAAKINPDDWLNNDYIMSQEGLEPEMTRVIHGPRYRFL